MIICSMSTVNELEEACNSFSFGPGSVRLLSGEQQRKRLLRLLGYYVMVFTRRAEPRALEAPTFSGFGKVEGGYAVVQALRRRLPPTQSGS